MVSKCAKIPVKLKYKDNFQYKDNFLVLFKNCNFFSLICNKDEYDMTIRELILSNQNPNNYICSHEPLYLGSNYVILEISTEFIETKNILFIYTPEMTESEFFIRTTEITEEVLNKNMELFQKTGITNFFGKFVMSSDRKKELANAYFLMGEYQKALGYYSEIKKEFTDIFERMSEWCKILLNLENEYNDKYYDVILLNGRADIMYKIIKILNTDTRIAMEYWLSTQYLPMRIAYFIDYICFKNFVEMEFSNKRELFYDKCRLNITKMLETSINYEKRFWESILIELTEKWHFK